MSSVTLNSIVVSFGKDRRQGDRWCKGLGIDVFEDERGHRAISLEDAPKLRAHISNLPDAPTPTRSSGKKRRRKPVARGHQPTTIYAIHKNPHQADILDCQAEFKVGEGVVQDRLAECRRWNPHAVVVATWQSIKKMEVRVHEIVATKGVQSGENFEFKTLDDWREAKKRVDMYLSWGVYQ